MKKVFYLFFVLVIITSFAGCGKNDSLSSQKQQQGSTEQVSEKKELSDEELAKIVAKSLGVPDKDGIDYGVSDEMYYFEAADRYYKNITFNENGEFVAHASVDPYSGELLRNIMEYSSPD